MGLNFEGEGDLDQIRALGDLPLYGHGHSRHVKNAMTGRSGTDQVWVFDYQYTTGGGKESHTWNQTIALYPGGGRNLPDFVLAPENVFHKIGQAFGYQDIDFDSNPTFSSRYLLRGPDEAAIRAVFRPEALAFFESQPSWTVQVKAGHVAVYRAGKRAKPEDLPTFAEQTRSIVRTLTRV